MNEVREVSGTAFVVAEFRARENAEPHPLYLDPIVPIFLDDRTKRQRMLFQIGSRLRQPMTGSERVTSTTGWTRISLAAFNRS